MSKTYGCFSCNNPFTVPSRYSGNSILCPHCGQQNKLSNTDVIENNYDRSFFKIAIILAICTSIFVLVIEFDIYGFIFALILAGIVFGCTILLGKIGGWITK